MMIRHPFDWIVESRQKYAFIVFSLIALVLMLSLSALGSPLQTVAAPSGIVSFELAGTLNQTQLILDSWGATGKIYAGINLGLDYLFLLAYANAIGMGCVMLARRWAARNAFGAAVGIFLAWGQVGAAFLDGVENAALIYLLLGGGNGGMPALARWCAIPKFLLVAIALIYLLVGVLFIGKKKQ